MLRDDFEDAVIATAWAAATSGSATVAETAGQARFTLPSSTAGSHVARYTSRITYDLTGSGGFIVIGTMVSTSVAATAFYQFYLNATNTFQWIQVSGTIYARSIVAGVSTDLFSAAWSGTTYKYLRIREAAGSIVWDSSSNGTSWTTRATLAIPFAITDLFIDFGATCGNVSSPGSFRLDDFNPILPALTTAWNWTEIVWPFDERTETVTVATDTAFTAMGYIVTADGVDAADNPSGNVRYWAGPADAGRILTEQPSQAAAQAMAVYLPLDGRLDLESMVEGHCYRVYHRSADGASYIICELFPRRTIYADDIKAESITALHIRAGSITADRLDVGKLSAITANIGQLVIDPDGYIWQGTGTATAPTTGLKIFEIGGVGKLSTYNAGVEQVTLDTDGVLKAGAGRVRLSSGGIQITSYLGTGYSQGNSLDFSVGSLYESYAVAGGFTTSIFTIDGRRSGLDAATSIVLNALSRPSTGLNTVLTVDWTGATIGGNSGGLNIGTATGAALGQLATSGVIAIRGAAINANNAIAAKGVGTTNATAAVSIVNNAGAINFQALDDGSIRTRAGFRWDLGNYIGGGTLTATGLIDVVINGRACKILSR